MLAPAGDRAAFLAALGAGADAVYLGAGELNARRGAKNFHAQDLPELCRLAHAQGARVYLTLNITILPDEVEAALQLAACAWAAGVDAFIVEDLGTVALLRELLPEARVHVSTQANVHSAAQVRAFAELGVRRVTLARELGIDEIRVLAAVAAEQAVEVECFVHGALCICYSGQCLMSSFIGRRSANRGLCAQPCRMTYEMVDVAGRRLADPGDYLLSPKDLAGIELVGELAEAGVASFKIEGRMKSASYVAAVVGAYRAAIDTLMPGVEGSVADVPPREPSSASGFPRRELKTVSPSQFSETLALAGDPTAGFPRTASATDPSAPRLTDAFNRQLTQGYLAGIRDNRLMDYRREKNRTTPLAQKELAVNAEAAIARATEHTTTLDFSARIKVGEPLQIRVVDAQGYSGSCEAALVEAARTKAITPEEIREHIGRLGGTPYELGALDLDLDEAAGLGFSALHAARRAAIADYETRRFFGGVARPETPSVLAAPDLPRRKTARLAPEVVAVAGSLSAARSALNAGAERVHVSALELLEAEPQAGIIPVLPRICHDRELDELMAVAERYRAAVAGNLGQLALCQQRDIPAEAHWSLGATNAYSVRELARRGAKLVWLSPELSGRQIADIVASVPVPVGIAISGRSELMVTEHCLLMAQGPCDQRCASCKRREVPTALRDRLGYHFPITTDPTGRSHLYNSVPLDLSEALPEIIAAGVDAIRIDGELLSPRSLSQECARIRRAIVAAHGSGEFEKPNTPVTKGHFFRGVV
ncbi:MAG: U32 family peptidase [Actinomycetia bacterium]|nr:U32 family peptidase [Actinomycetes bacterium]